MEPSFRNKGRENDGDSQWSGRGAGIVAPVLCAVWGRISGFTKRAHKVRKHGKLLTLELTLNSSKAAPGSTVLTRRVKAAEIRT